MSTVYLNGEFMPMTEAKISPMDRGFLFGDGIYEVVPSYSGKLVGFEPHIRRMQDGLTALEIEQPLTLEQWRTLTETLLEKNGGGDLGVYMHVSRGADIKRAHGYPASVKPTVFAFTFEIPSEPVADLDKVKTYKAVTEQDLRWQRCNIKSTALLGNVMHYQASQRSGAGETILFNRHNELTEAASCNVFVVKNGVIATPPLDHQILPGITRHILLDVLRQDGSLPVEERTIDMDEVKNADEIWLTSSSKEIAPVVELDGKPVGNGKVGSVWLAAQRLFSECKYNY
ncbi:D-amino-acid transaminase [Saliniradius amylolyticus]|uniref:Aminodeoxychorismate lyase n=1 Tax=Saliniradius amylolyticus TaxID=2183582 RepID=A0A2S2E3D9_9ALTE|nr:D-amino acid aminotransferase [Saliniradius amylolyticus]AWL12165.1 D-amino-acid transaminase [Saliniradius amylolyticus]